MQKKYLFLGPKKNVNNSKLTGGVLVLFENLLEYCNNNNIEYDVVDTNKANYKNKFYAYIQIVCLLFVKAPRVTHISVHGTANDYLLIAPFALLVSKLLSKHLSLRKFAGNFIEIYENYSLIQQIIVNIILKYSSCNFFETKYLVEYFKKFNTNTFWFPNVRTKSYYQTDKKYHKKFIFLGAITEEKGIDILCETSILLSNEYKIDLYGKLHNKYTKDYFNSYNVDYIDCIDICEVTKVLAKYDVLVLPSFREGYPGVIVEALSVGLPIIATNLKGIVEMIDDNVSILFEPGNIQELKSAIESFNDLNYTIMSEQSLRQFNNFDSTTQTKLFIKRTSNV